MVTNQKDLTTKMLGCRRHECIIQASLRYGHKEKKNLCSMTCFGVALAAIMCNCSNEIITKKNFDRYLEHGPQRVITDTICNAELNTSYLFKQSQV